MTKRTPVISAILLAMIVSMGYSAQQSPGSSSRGRSLWGDWNMNVSALGGGDVDRHESILSFWRDREGDWKGQSIDTLRGVRDLEDVTFEAGNLTYSITSGRGDQTTTLEFAGKVEDGKLTGTVTNIRGEFAFAGVRAARVSRAVGEYEVKFRIGERDITCALVLKADQEGKLSGEWKSEYGEHVISDLKYERGALSFTRKSTFGERVIESTFEGTLGREGLTGKIKSQMGEVDVTGSLKGRELVGTWNLDMTSEQQKRKQRLRVNSDLSGLYGSLPIKKIDFEDGKVTFKAKKSGQLEYEVDFAGRIEESKLVGEMKTLLTVESFRPQASTWKVTGAKVERTFGRSTDGSRAGR